ncbi:hypothetical protein NHG28_06775 [Aerococcaceae bacterium NML201209]|nr:hypothetical protein [Aerococcaceae bacterium NML201209]MCW6664342.1 hypothetical protein [Aerococcaceae bacterium NML191219]
MVQLQVQNEEIMISVNDLAIGTIKLYRNEWHIHHQYLQIQLNNLHTEWSRVIFEEIYRLVQRPLQVMLDSNEVDCIDFLIKGGFLCRRKCYERDVTWKDYVGNQVVESVNRVEQNEADYLECCRVLFKHYVKTHLAINPLTADFGAFVGALPKSVLCEKEENSIVHVAFIEGNEIAYVASEMPDCFVAFAERIICQLFRGNSSIYFEADDCDEVAMQLVKLFSVNDEVSYDTYVYNPL